jgi:hypothetical protein
MLVPIHLLDASSDFFPLSTSPFLALKVLKRIHFRVHYSVSENFILVKTLLTIPPGCHRLVQFCSTSFAPLDSSLCVSLSLWYDYPHCCTLMWVGVMIVSLRLLGKWCNSSKRWQKRMDMGIQKRVDARKIKLPLCWSNSAPRYEDVWWSGGLYPRIFNLGTTWRWVVSFTARPIYTRGKSPLNLLIGGWVGHRASLDAVKRRNISYTTGNPAPITRPPRPYPVFVLTKDI